jgi:hypothetical protein
MTLEECRALQVFRYGVTEKGFHYSCQQSMISFKPVMDYPCNLSNRYCHSFAKLQMMRTSDPTLDHNGQLRLLLSSSLLKTVWSRQLPFFFNNLTLIFEFESVR